MAKLKHIIKQLSKNDYEAIYESLMESNAEKSAFLLQAMREKAVTDAKIMSELNVNTNAYYTLRSRLNQKIEEYLLQQMESPRTDLLKKVANINEVVFTKKRAISVATLKKLEKELLDYDLSNELTIVYKTLKKLHLNSSDYFTYSKLYNNHVAYMLAVDKAEDLLADYFKKFGIYSLTNDETDKLGLVLLSNEMDNVCNLYQSHRLEVYQNCLSIFHRLFIEEGEISGDNRLPIEDVFSNIENTFLKYKQDSIYFHIRKVFEFLRLEYYNYYKLHKKADSYFEAVNDDLGILLTNYTYYTFPAKFLSTKVERYLRLGIEHELYDENEGLFEGFVGDVEDIPQYINYIAYRALCCYYVRKYDEAARLINNFLNEVSLKKFPHATLEIKCLLALQYCCVRDYDLFNQLVNSIQRQIRILGRESCESIILFLKILKTASSDVKRDKHNKMESYINRFEKMKEGRMFTPKFYIKMDHDFIDMLIK